MRSKRDVHLRTGSSHSDMLECVEAATRKVIEMGYAVPNEGHHLVGVANQRDLTVRFMARFGHYLKGAPTPGWLTEGVLFLKKDAKPPAGNCLYGRTLYAQRSRRPRQSSCSARRTASPSRP